MDLLWKGGIGLGVFMLIVSSYTIIRERKRIADVLVPGENMPSWYTNVNVRKHAELLCNSVLLIMISSGLALFRRQTTFFSLWVALMLFLSCCMTFLFVIYEEKSERIAARHTGRALQPWFCRIDFHQGMARAVCFLGVSMTLLATSLFSMHAAFFEAADWIFWPGAGLILISGLYWLSGRVIQVYEAKKRETRSSSSSSQPD